MEFFFKASVITFHRCNVKFFSVYFEELISYSWFASKNNLVHRVLMLGLLGVRVNLP